MSLRLLTRHSIPAQSALLACLGYGAILIAIPEASAQSTPEVRTEMQSLLTPLRSLQPYLVSQEKFAAPENKDRILKLLHDIRGNFHTLETIPTRFHKQPGFDENVRQVTDLLNDASRRFDEGKPGYAWWRLRTLPNSCFSCHATYQVDVHYSNADVIDPTLDPVNRSRFLLATRQFAEAQKTLLEVVEDPKYRLYAGEALRSLLIVATRISKDPAKGAALFQEVAKRSTLPEEDREEVDRWIKAFQSWSRERSAPKPTFQAGEKIILKAMSVGMDYNRDDVGLLRGTAIIQEALEQGNAPDDERRKGLYLLGLAYSQLPMFFIDGWAEMYLERCIQEFPKTVEAQRAFKAYRSIVLDDFTGSGGTEMPPEIQLHIDELRKKAFGEVTVPEQV